VSDLKVGAASFFSSPLDFPMPFALPKLAELPRGQVPSLPHEPGVRGTNLGDCRPRAPSFRPVLSRGNLTIKALPPVFNFELSPDGQKLGGLPESCNHVLQIPAFAEAWQYFREPPRRGQWQIGNGDPWVSLTLV
jgi:hypothetical protein